MAKAVSNRESLHPRQARLRRRNENGLAESENGGGTRKVFGCGHIAGARAERLDRLHGKIRVPYLNGFARACSRPWKPTPRPAAQVLPADRHPHTCEVPKALPEAGRDLCAKCVWQPAAPSALRFIHGNHP